MIVFRLQFPNGEGAYHSPWDWPDDDKPAFLRDMYWKPSLGPDPHPAPSEDGLGPVSHDDYFGFAHIDQLHAWFFRDGEQDARRYASKGMQIVLWEIDQEFVREGGRQCVFKKHEAQRIESWAPEEFRTQFPPTPGFMSLQ